MRLEYKLTKNVLSRIKRTNQNFCRNCKEKFQIGQPIVSKTMNHNHMKRYCKPCAVKLNI